MHIHHNPLANPPVGVHSAAGAEKAAAAQRAAETRRKLLNSSARIGEEGEESLDGGEVLAVGARGGGSYAESEHPRRALYRRAAHPQEEEPRQGPISLWA